MSRNESIISTVPDVGGGDASCDLKDDYTVVSGSPITLADSSSTIWVACKFVPTANYSACKVELEMWENGSPQSAGYLTNFLYSDSGGSPGTQLAVADYPIRHSELPNTSGTLTNYTFASPVSLTSGSTYWLVMRSSFSSGSINWRVQSTPNNGDFFVKSSANGSTWANYSVRQFNARIYGQ
jgi:hypothetical protein